MASIFDTWAGGTYASIKSAGISSARIRLTGDDGYATLGVVRDGKLNITPLSKPDTYLRPRTWGFHVEGVFTSIQGGPLVTAALEQMITGTNLPIGIVLGLAGDSLYLNSPIATPVLSLKWKLSCGSQMDDFRTVEYTVRGNVKIGTEADALITSSPEAAGTLTSGDLLPLTATPILTDQVPNGIKTIEFKETSDATYADFGDFTDANYTFECIGGMGGGGRAWDRTTAVKWTFDAMLNETDDTKLNLFDLMAQNNIMLKITHIDGVVLTLPSNRIGITTEFANEGNVDAIRHIKIHGEGAILAGDFADLWS